MALPAQQHSADRPGRSDWDTSGTPAGNAECARHRAGGIRPCDPFPGAYRNDSASAHLRYDAQHAEQNWAARPIAIPSAAAVTPDDV